MRRVEEAASMQTGLPTITIRGHHLILLGYYLSAMPTAEEYFRHVVKNDVEVIGFYVLRYGAQHYLNELILFEKVAAGGRTVKVSASLDDLCETCPNKGPSCSHLHFFDFSAAKMFGLNLGEYPADEIADKLKKKFEGGVLKGSSFLVPAFVLVSVLDRVASLPAYIAGWRNRSGRKKNPLPSLTEEMREAYFRQMMAGYNALKRQQKVA